MEHSNLTIFKNKKMERFKMLLPWKHTNLPIAGRKSRFDKVNKRVFVVLWGASLSIWSHVQPLKPEVHWQDENDQELLWLVVQSPWPLPPQDSLRGL